MGVTGLWKLIEPSGKPVPLETLENKILAIGKYKKNFIEWRNNFFLLNFFNRHLNLASSSS